MKIKKSVKDYFLRPLFESFHIDTYSRPALNNLDSKLEKYLDFDGGYFLEVGANDGFKQSNTYFYERIKKWRGVLIEPIPILYKQCKKLRKQSEVFNLMCSSPENSGTYKTIRYADLMSQMSGSLMDLNSEDKHIKKGLEIQNINETYQLDIKCLTLSEVIDKSSFGYFDFMSIDVEGHEFQVLRGLNLERHAPTYLLVEAWDHEKNEIIEYLEAHYVLEDYLTERDILFRKR